MVAMVNIQHHGDCGYGMVDGGLMAEVKERGRPASPL
jgi:hypothetical protein